MPEKSLKELMIASRDKAKSQLLKGKDPVANTVVNMQFGVDPKVIARRLLDQGLDKNQVEIIM